MSRSLVRFSALGLLFVFALVIVMNVGIDRGSAQTEPPPVSETLEAAKLGALATGTLLAGPGQVTVPAGMEPGELGELKQRLWQQDFGHAPGGETLVGRRVTLTVQGLGSCELRFTLAAPGRGSRAVLYQFDIGPNHASRALSAREIRRVSWDILKAHANDCPFLWVLRAV